MNTGNAHISDLLPDYALDLLDEEQRRLADAHLEGCEMCRQELRAYRDAAGQLAYAIQSRQPPARLRDALVSETAGRQGRTSQAGQDRVPQRSAWYNGLFSRPVFAGLAILLAVILLVGNLLLYRQVQELRAIAFAKPQVVQLEAEAAQPTAGGILLIQNRGLHGILIVDGMQPLAAEQQYQLWLVREGERTSGGVFSVDEVGYGYLSLDNPQPLTDYESIGITIEPFGGSPGPTSPKIMGADL